MNIIILAFCFLLMLFLKSSAVDALVNPEQSATFALGFILVIAFLVGKEVKRLNLPQITGYILAGIVCGPFVLKFLSVEEVKSLQILDGLALSLIALTAGGELRLTRLRGRFRAIWSISIFQTVVILAGFIIFGLVGARFFPFFEARAPVEVFAISLLMGTLATATSPSTTIAVINETRSWGKFTDLVLSAAVVKDILIIILFAFALSLSRSLVSPSHGFDAAFLLEILWEVGGSILLGACVGAAIILYLKYIRRETAIFILGVAFFTYQISHHLEFHPLLICLVAGFLVENLSTQGEKLILAIEKSSLPIYVVFFSISGASLDLDALMKSWPLALTFVFFRVILKFTGTYLGVRVGQEEREFRNRGWMGFISQAGVALGMVIIIERTFPGWGKEFKTLALATIALNQIVGPVLLQKLLIKVGETGKK